MTIFPGTELFPLVSNLLQIEKAKQEQAPIKVTLPDGTVKDGVKLVTTPMDIAKTISKSLANNAVVAKVDGNVWDLLRPLEGDCKLSLHTFDEDEGKDVRQPCPCYATFMNTSILFMQISASFQTL